ncbi:hypothetical protein CAP48_00465 [Advenella sp. S44]|nr:hypothetical protein CAP48_00465 [Advenella sp. S44]
MLRCLAKRVCSLIRQAAFPGPMGPLSEGLFARLTWSMWPIVLTARDRGALLLSRPWRRALLAAANAQR